MEEDGSVVIAHTRLLSDLQLHTVACTSCMQAHIHSQNYAHTHITHIHTQRLKHSKLNV